MGQVAVRIEDLSHGYNGRQLFKNADLTIEKGERVAIIGPNGELGGHAGHSNRCGVACIQARPLFGCQLGLAEVTAGAGQRSTC